MSACRRKRLPYLVRRQYYENGVAVNLIVRIIGAGLGIALAAGAQDLPPGVLLLARVKAHFRAELARLPNVNVKVGGLGMRINGFDFEKGKAPPSSAHLAQTWKPWMETCIEAFGANRCMFESNFPVDKGSYSYATGWNAFKRLTAGASPADRHALFEGTASRVYRLG